MRLAAKDQLLTTGQIQYIKRKETGLILKALLEIMPVFNKYSCVGSTGGNELNEIDPRNGNVFVHSHINTGIISVWYLYYLNR